MECIAIYDIDDMLEEFPSSIDSDTKIVREFLGIKVNLSKDRYVTFKNKGTTCEHCGLEGEFFALEVQKGCSNGVFNLIGVDESDREVVISVTTNKRVGKIPVGTVLCSECQHKLVSYSKDKDYFRR